MSPPPLKSLGALQAHLRAFAQARDWEQFHSPKNLAMALIVEAQSHALDKDKREQVALEMADVFIYLVRLADRLDIDLLEAAERKMALNELRYPADKVRGSARKAEDY